MQNLIAALIPLGLVVAFSPLPIIAMITVLFSVRARSNGPAFLVGWVAGLTLVGGLLLAFGVLGGDSNGGKPLVIVQVIKLVVGGLGLWWAIHKWRTRPRRGEEPPMPKWIARADALTVVQTFIIALLLAAPINSKCLLVVIAAVAIIGKAGLGAVQSWTALAIFIVCGSIAMMFAVASYFMAGEKAERLLAHVRTWLIKHNAVTMTVLFGVVGAIFVSMGVVGLVR